MTRPERKRDARQLVILTGLSGSGKGSVLKTFEDLGFYCVDNLPVSLIPTFSELYEESRGEIERAALLVDAREGEQLEKLPGIYRKLSSEHPATLVFIEASDEALLRRELMLFPDWYLTRHLKFEPTDAQRRVLDEAFAAILTNNLAQPKVYVHRDWHSRNLMLTGEDNPGVLDFQDAVYGPITYDLVSIYKDAYIRWDEDRVLDWAIRYWQAARRAGLPVAADFADFYRDFEWMGVQRHIKVLGIFARLHHRDGKAAYLDDMPTVMGYLRRACERYAALHPLHNLLDQLEGKAVEAGYTF